MVIMVIAVSQVMNISVSTFLLPVLSLLSSRHRAPSHVKTLQTSNIQGQNKVYMYASSHCGSEVYPVHKPKSVILKLINLQTICVVRRNDEIL